MAGRGADHLAPVIAVVGPSGVGKDSVIAGLCAARPDFERVRRVITRPMEAGGEEYHTATREAFDRMQAEGAFALSWEAHGLRYGIPCTIRQQRRRAAAVVVNLSRSVLMDAQTRFGNLVVIALRASPNVLALRLSARGRETPQDQSSRLQRAGLDLPEGLNRVHTIDNSGSLADTIQAVLDVLEAESAKR